MNRIAIPTHNEMVEQHFGHSKEYTILSIDNYRNVVHSETIPVKDSVCKSDMAALLKQKGVTALLVGGMGTGAYQAFQRYGINVVRGCNGNVLEVVKNYLAGKIQDSNTACTHDHHHNEFHDCKHHKQ